MVQNISIWSLSISNGRRWNNLNCQSRLSSVLKWLWASWTSLRWERALDLDYSSPIKLQVGKGAVVRFEVCKAQVAPAEV